MGFHFLKIIVFTIYHMYVSVQACMCVFLQVSAPCTLLVTGFPCPVDCAWSHQDHQTVISKCTFQNPSHIFSLTLGNMMQHIIVVFLLFYIFQSKFTQSAKRIAPQHRSLAQTPRTGTRHWHFWQKGTGCHTSWGLQTNHRRPRFVCVCASVVSNLCFCTCGLSTRTGSPNTVRLLLKVKTVFSHVFSLREKKQLQLQLFLLHYTIKFSVKVISLVCSGLHSFKVNIHIVQAWIYIVLTIFQWLTTLCRQYWELMYSSLIKLPLREYAT